MTQSTVALVTVHGMGRTPQDYHLPLTKAVSRRLGASAASLHIGRVYYQSILQPNEDRVWARVSPKVRWNKIRELLLFGFADAAGFEDGKEEPQSVYWQTQVEIARTLLKAREALGQSGPLIIAAHSLGCQVVSCYFWDARPEKVPVAGIWQDIEAAAPAITGGRALTADEIAYLRGSHLRQLITTGCNIPIFVAAHAGAAILPIRPNPGFAWHNYYDPDDVLGWPLADLSDAYGQVVTDHQVNASGGVLGWLFKSWNPLSHEQYWSDGGIATVVAEAIRAEMA